MNPSDFLYDYEGGAKVRVCYVLIGGINFSKVAYEANTLGFSKEGRWVKEGLWGTCYYLGEEFFWNSKKTLCFSPFLFSWSS